MFQFTVSRLDPDFLLYVIGVYGNGTYILYELASKRSKKPWTKARNK